MGATYSAFQLIGAPLLGRWSDYYGRRKILLLSQIGTLLSWLIFFGAMYLPVTNLFDVNSEVWGSFTLTLPLIVLFLARALDGLTGGNVSVANAYLADITEDSMHSKNFGQLAISSNMGYIFGPALAGLLGATMWGEKLPVLAAIFISVLATIIIIFLLPENKPQTISEDPEPASVSKVLGPGQKECFRIECKGKITFNDILKMKDIRFLLTVYFLVFLAFNFFYIAFPVHAVQTLNWNLTATGAFFSFLSIVMVIVQGPVLSFVSKKWSDYLLVISGSFFLALSFVFFVSTQSWIVYVGAALLALGNGIMWPSLLSLISKTSKKFQGSIQGYAGSLGSAASIIGLLAGGILYNLIAANIFVLAAITVFIIFVATYKIFSSQFNLTNTAG